MKHACMHCLPLTQCVCAFLRYASYGNYVPRSVSLLSSSTRLMSWSKPFRMPLTGWFVWYGGCVGQHAARCVFFSVWGLGCFVLWMCVGGDDGCEQPASGTHIIHATPTTVNLPTILRTHAHTSTQNTTQSTTPHTHKPTHLPAPPGSARGRPCPGTCSNPAPCPSCSPVC